MIDLKRREQLAKEIVDEARASMSKGELALYALDVYSSVGIKLPPPEWAIWQIVSCYRDFKEGKPTAYRPGAIKSTPAPSTLGEAFGVPDHPGGLAAAKKRRKAALAAPRLIAAFSGDRRLARDEDGRRAALSEPSLVALRDDPERASTGVSDAQVRDFLSKTADPARKKSSSQ